MTKTASKIPSFFHDKPLFGLDIGHGSLKVMQLNAPVAKSGHPRTVQLVGYGYAEFDKAALVNGVIVQPEVIAKAAQELFANNLIGDITTRRAAIAIPAYRTFTRSLQVPQLKRSELAEAVQLEAEQYISLPLEQLYLDYQVTQQTADATTLFVVAVPQTIVDSYLELSQILGLEMVLIEPTLASSGRLFSIDEQSDVASLIIDFGSQSADISIFDKQVLVTGTVEGGGENFTASIRSKLGVTPAEAQLIKTRYGLSVSKRQTQIKEALEPTLQQIVKEIQRMMRYYDEHYGTEHSVGQIITLGGGANMPGLSEYLTNATRLAVRHSDPWQYFHQNDLAVPSDADKPMYATAAGLSLAPPKEIFQS
jgi:type IV pilus assembly protein PilM